MKKLPKRKSTRLKEYDYSGAGHYFVTICIKDKHEILGEIVGDGVLDVPHCKLSKIGKTVDSQIQIMNKLYKNIRVDKYVISQIISI